MKYAWIGLVGVIVILLGLGYRFQRLELTSPGTPLPKVEDGVGGLLIPHHLAAEPLIRTGLGAVARDIPKYDWLVLMVPNHKEVGNVPVLTDQPASERGVGADCRQQIMRLAFVEVNTAVINQEHAVVDILPLITEYFPGAEVFPLVISTGLLHEDSDRLVEALSSCSNTLVVAAIDFSHYLPVTEADKRDAVTKKLIEDRNYERIWALDNEYTDAPKALVPFLALMEKRGTLTIDWLAEGNSGRMARDETAASTSYLVAVWK